MAFGIKRKRNINISKVVAKVVGAVIALYVGGTIISELGTVMDCTASPFYDGLALIGWTVSDNVIVNATSGLCNTTDFSITAGTYSNLITNVSGTGILSVIGIVAIATIVTEFVEFSM